jgi:hypothetical protein
MSLTARENFLNFYRNKPLNRFPDLYNDINGPFFITGMDERSPCNETGKDWYGCDWVFDPVGQACVLDVTKPPLLDDVGDWREVIKPPDFMGIDWVKNATIDGVDNYDPHKINYLMLQTGPFERLHTLMGFENALCAMMVDPKETTALLDFLMEIKLLCIEVLIDHYKAEVICFHDDWGTQKDLFFSPEMWRRIIKPQIQRAVNMCHKNGAFFELHCCGKIDRIIPEIAELGIDSLQCMGINDVAGAKRICGDRMAFMVSLRYQEWAALNQTGSLTEEVLRELIRKEITEENQGGRYFPFLIPANEWWFPVALDEIKRCSDEIFGCI